jgi:hypothetical protein
MLVASFSVAALGILYIFYNYHQTIKKLTNKIGELSTENEFLRIDIKGKEILDNTYELLLRKCLNKEKHLTEEVALLRKKYAKKHKEKTEK